MSIPGTYSSMAMSQGGNDILFIGEGGRVTATSTSSVSVPVPSNAIAGDYLIIPQQYADSTTASTPSGWTQLAFRQQNSDYYLKLIGRFYDGSTVPSISWDTNSVPSRHFIASCLAFRNVNTTTQVDRTPEEDGFSYKQGTNTLITNHGQTTTVTNCFFLNMIAHDENTSSSTNLSDWACSSLESMNELVEYSTTNGQHGGFAMAGGIKRNTGALASTTFEKVSSPNKTGGYFALALRPAT